MNFEITWFRTDLRTQDNSALIQSMRAGPTIAIYIATPKQWEEHNDAPIKIDFWRRNLIELQKSLSVINVPLFFFQVPDYKEIPKIFEYLSSQLSISGLHFNKEYPLNELIRDRGICSSLQNQGIRVSQYDDQVLLSPGSVLNSSKLPYKVFTPFAKACKKQISPLDCSHNLNTAVKQKSLPTQSIPSHFTAKKSIHIIQWPKPNKHWSSLWPAGEFYAQKKLTNYSQHLIGDYKNSRDYPFKEGTSSISPYISSGVISIRQCWASAQTYQSNEGVDTWLNELLWREFYKHITYHFPHVCQNKCWNSKYEDLPWNKDAECFERWSLGKTGYPLIDAAMRQLKQTGWMHNRLRMVCAMFLSKNLLLDWRLGEQWFMSNLIDGDFSANNGGWQWASSTGTDAAPYFRVFNPARQSERFDKDGFFIKQYLPELASANKKDLHYGQNLACLGYPKPMIDLKISRKLAIEAFKSI